MMLLTSAKDGFYTLGFWRFFKLALAVLLLPALVGGPLVMAQVMLGTPQWGQGALVALAFSWLLVFSPAIGWFSLVLASPLIAVLMDRGLFGWLPALALGVVLGAGIAWMMDYALALSLVGGQMVLLRFLLGRLYPASVQAGPAPEV